MSREEYVQRYIESLQSMFGDTVERSFAGKYGRTREQEFVLEHIFKMSPDEIRAIYDGEYRKYREAERNA